MIIKIGKIQFQGWESFSCKLSENLSHLAIHMYINCDDMEVIDTRVKWCYDSEYISREAFPFTKEGYKDACKSIQGTYEYMLKELCDI